MLKECTLGSIFAAIDVAATSAAAAMPFSMRILKLMQASSIKLQRESYIRRRGSLNFIWKPQVLEPQSTATNARLVAESDEVFSLMPTISIFSAGRIYIRGGENQLIWFSGSIFCSKQNFFSKKFLKKELFSHRNIFDRRYNRFSFCQKPSIWKS